MRIFQDDRGEIIAIKNKTVEKIICLENFNEESKNLDPFIIWFKFFEETYWYRCFLDVGACFWEVYYEFDRADFEEFDESDNYYILSKNYRLKNSKVLSALVNSTGISGVKLEIFFFEKRKIIFWRDKFEGSDRLEIV